MVKSMFNKETTRNDIVDMGTKTIFQPTYKTQRTVSDNGLPVLLIYRR